MTRLPLSIEVSDLPIVLMERPASSARGGVTLTTSRGLAAKGARALYCRVAAVG